MKTTPAQKQAIERLAAIGKATNAVRFWLEARRDTDEASNRERRLEQEALDALACIRPGKSITLNGAEYVGVTSRGHVDVRPITKRKGKGA